MISTSLLFARMTDDVGDDDDNGCNVGDNDDDGCLVPLGEPLPPFISTGRSSCVDIILPCNSQFCRAAPNKSAVSAGSYGGCCWCGAEMVSSRWAIED